MILVSEIAKTLQDILNNENSEIQEQNPTDFYYRVETAGFHIDKVSDKQKGKNFIPVFISTVGGQYDPVPALKRVAYTLPITFYFPVRFKQEMFSLTPFLADVFVGKMINYGDVSGVCLSNISVANYGEIVDLDLTQFKEWVNGVYKEEIEVMQPYLSMSFNLYLTTVDNSFIYANKVKYSMTIGETTIGDLVFTQAGTGTSISPISQQLIDTDTYSKNVANITNRSASIVVYPQDTKAWHDFIDAYENGTLANKSVVLTKTYDFINTPYTKNYIVLSVNQNIQYGDLLSFTITFGDEL